MRGADAKKDETFIQFRQVHHCAHPKQSSSRGEGF
jgi:hypothetical protein